MVNLDPGKTPGANGAAPPRKLLGRCGWQDRICVYLGADCLETEVRGLAELQRRRVYLDDVVLVTRCRRINYLLIVPGVLGTLTFGGLTALAGLVLMTRNGVVSPADVPAFWVSALFFVVLGGLIITHLIRRDDIITVFGRRKKIELRYGFFKRTRCDAAHGAIIEGVSAAIERSRAALERDRPPPAEMFQPVMTAPTLIIEPAIAPSIEPLAAPEIPAAIPAPEIVPPAPPRVREPDLPLMPEIKLTPKQAPDAEFPAGSSGPAGSE